MAQLTRAAARAKILAAANNDGVQRRLRSRRQLPPFRPYSARNLNEAVGHCRRRLLVTNDVLVAAGFQPVRTRTATSLRRAA